MNQLQHVLPQVYLKQFGYRNKNNNWEVSVIIGKSQKVKKYKIKSFTAQNNIFNLDSNDPKIKSIFEQTNGQIETELPKIISDLDRNNSLSERSYAFLLYLIVRSEPWRNFVQMELQSPNKENFIKSIIYQRAIDDGFAQNPSQHPLNNLINENAQSVLNTVLYLFFDYLNYRIGHFDLVLLKSNDSMPFYTSDNPIKIDIKSKPFDVFTIDSEVFFPLSPKYYIYGYYKGSKTKKHYLSKFTSNFVHSIDKNVNIELQRITLMNPSKYLIMYGEHDLDNYKPNKLKILITKLKFDRSVLINKLKYGI